MNNNSEVTYIEDYAKFIRISALEMTRAGNSSHIACVLSMADLLAELFGNYLTLKHEDPKYSERDRFILSKGHGGAGVYAALAKKDFFDHEILMSHYQNGSALSGHVSHKGVPGVEFSTGSLGHGLPVAIGIALNAKLLGSKYKTVCLMGDGECNEGTTWESALIASHHKLSSLTVIIDANKYQSLRTTKETLNMDPMSEKWDSFGWEVLDIDGHNINEIKSALHHEVIINLNASLLTP